MDIQVNDLSSVDKEITIIATREDLSETFDKAYRKYKRKIQLPGFRPGHVPLGMIRSRFGDEIEREEIGKYVQTVYERDIVPQYEPVGESQMTDFTWENDELKVTFKTGAKPEFDLVDLSTVTVDKMVHDVTDEEVEEEIQRTLERNGNWVEIEGEITEECRITADVTSLNEEGEPIEGETEVDQKIDLRKESAADFKSHLTGKKVGDTVDIKMEEEGETDHFRVQIKKAEEMKAPDLTDDFAKEQSRDQAKNVDEFRSYIKSQIQQYYDQSSGDLFRQDVVNALTDAHDIAVPEVMQDQILENYVDYLKRQSQGQLPPDFNEAEYKANLADQAVKDGKWAFISDKLYEKFDDIEIQPEDIDTYIQTEAAKYGIPVDQMKSYFAQNPSMLEPMRRSIRENKLYAKLEEVVSLNELSKDAYRKKSEERNKEQSEEQKTK